MKNFIFSVVGLLILNSCGDMTNLDNQSNQIKSININNLSDGYVIEGQNSKNKSVRLTYCNRNYSYEGGNEYFSGTFNINNSQIIVNMFDAKGGSYIIDTNTGYIDVGNYYYIYDVSDEIAVEGIYKSIVSRFLILFG